MNAYADLLSEDRFAIFLFHGVIGDRRHPVRNYMRKHLPLGDFVAVLDELVQLGTPVSLPEIVDLHRDGERLPERAFAVTFDDGFENNYSIAAPALAERGVPATFYVTTNFVEHGARSWIDDIEHAFEERDEVVAGLPWRDDAVRCETPEQKVALLDEIRAHVKTDATIDPYEFAADVCAQNGAEELEPDPELDAKMSWAQVRELAAHPLFTIGGHGRTHRILAFVDDTTLVDEVDGSLAVLRAHVPSVEHFSYPEGLASSYSERVVNALQRNGIVCAPTAIPGTNALEDDLFALRRVTVV